MRSGLRKQRCGEIAEILSRGDRESHLHEVYVLVSWPKEVHRKH